MKTKLAGLLVGSIACSGAIAAPLDYDYIEAGLTLSFDDDSDTTKLGAEANKTFGDHFFVEGELGYSIVSIDGLSDDVTVTQFGAAVGTVINLPKSAELALSFQYDWAEAELNGSKASANARFVEAELDIPVATNLTVEVDLIRTFSEEDREAAIYAGVEGGEKGRLQWEGGITRTIDVDGDDDAVHSLTGRAVFPVGKVSIYAGGSAQLDAEPDNEISVFGGVRLDI